MYKNSRTRLSLVKFQMHGADSGYIKELSLPGFCLPFCALFSEVASGCC